MSKQEAIFLISLGVSGLVLGWMISAICGLSYLLLVTPLWIGPPLGSILCLWFVFSNKTIQDVLGYALIFSLGLGVGGLSANTVNSTPQEICERN